ncbi:trehalose-6-phosphate synthase [Puia sp. P3]|uniref:trehalose-6-phosphate synthase n=1 Tax=Puia sp. P3 TaxID=3423952 RepID=UPI003D6709A9
MQKKRLIIVSNRLPVTVEHNDSGYITRPSSGGLVSAITSYLNKDGKAVFSEAIWAGVPGVSEKVWNIAANQMTTNLYGLVPIFINWKIYELYYNGFSNSVLWPLFHYFPSYVDYNQSYYKAYLDVNETFANILSAHLRKDDVVWIQDYHLLPLAGMLRKKFPKLTIGFFSACPLSIV